MIDKPVLDRSTKYERESKKKTATDYTAGRQVARVGWRLSSTNKDR